MPSIIFHNNHIHYTKTFFDSEYRSGLLRQQSVDGNYGLREAKFLWRIHPEYRNLKRIETFIQTDKYIPTPKSEKETTNDVFFFHNNQWFFATEKTLSIIETRDVTICLGNNQIDTEQLYAFMMAGSEPVKAIEEFYELKGVDAPFEIVSISIEDFEKGAK